MVTQRAYGVSAFGVAVAQAAPARPVPARYGILKLEHRFRCANAASRASGARSLGGAPRGAKIELAAQSSISAFERLAARKSNLQLQLLSASRCENRACSSKFDFS
jgi:hypothetical protein